ncbi:MULTISPECIES: ABC transporter permease [Clostridia]|uniref:ABC transporter permease n=1 Tax=Clostridia TaxID=186801 RepID=UPI000EA37D1E|nr:MULTISPECIES: ABC transporter permease [Clostridia]NBJ68807.1 ABC transporter permease [Roseburia sp. 1XD42-34]RKI80186.1 ABC transporter permease [Clostridium sp. 1xD42-85]
MFKEIKQVLQEQIEYRSLIIRMATFETKGMYQGHYLGSLWQFISPALQVAIYWIVFGIGLRSNRTIDADVPFILWLLMGLIPWFFIAPTVIQGSNSVHQKVSLVSKMNFPVSLLPTIKIVGNSFQFFILLFIMFFLLIVYGVDFSVHLIQLPYYIICLYLFLFSFTILSSTISTLVRDYQQLLQSMMRMLLYLSPILWNPESKGLPDFLSNILKLNPFYYIIDGIRSSILGSGWFFDDITYTLYFWFLTFLLLYFGSKSHLKFKKSFVDYL